MKVALCATAFALFTLAFCNNGYSGLNLEHIVYQNSRKNNIIFLHHIYGNAESFLPLARNPEIKKNFNSYLLSLPNFGNSYDDPNFSRESMARDVKNFILDYGLKNVYLVGHSIGSVVALTVAAKYGTLIKGVLSLDLMPFELPQALTDLLLDFTRQIGQLNLSQSLENIRQDFLKIVPDPVFAQAFIEGLEGSGQNYRMTVNFNNYARNLRKLAQPAIIKIPFYGKFKLFTGNQNPFYNPAQVADLNQYYPRFNAQTDLKVVDGGHFAFRQNWDKVAEMILDFIS